MGTAVKPSPRPDGSADPEDSSVSLSAKTVEADGGGLPADAGASLERLLASESIARAPRLRSVLKFLIDALLEGRTASLNEQAIGQAVFDRPAGYNPGEDNIVRVTMRHLRERIDEYYRGEGSNEKYVLVIPKGKYLPAVILRPTENIATPAPEKPSSIVLPEQTADTESKKIAPKSPSRLATLIPWAIALILAAAVIVLASRPASRTAVIPPPHDAGLLSLLLANGKQTTLVATDSNLEAYRVIFRKTVSLDSYLADSYEHTAIPTDYSVTAGAWRYIDLSDQTGLTSSIIAAELQAAAVPSMLRIRHPHNISMRDFQHDNHILLGGPWINPWGQLFEGRLNFRILPLKESPWLSEIHNTNPLPHEKQDYAPHQRDSMTVNYARVALLRNFSNDGYIILLGATSEAALEAAGKYIAAPQRLAELLQSFKVHSIEQLPSFEVVIEVAGHQSVPEDIHIVAERVVPPQ